MMALYTIYTRDLCGFCDAAKALMDSLSLPYEELNLESHPHHRDELLTKVPPGTTTVPQIFVGDLHIGGFDDFKVYVEESLQSGR